MHRSIRVSVPICPHLVVFPDPPAREQQSQAGFADGVGKNSRRTSLVDCPIEEYIDEDGDLSYMVLLANGTRREYMLGESMPLEEARAHIRELMFMDIRNGRYDPLHMQLRAGLALLPDAAVDVAWEEPSYLHHSFNAVPASAMAVASAGDGCRGRGALLGVSGGSGERRHHKAQSDAVLPLLP
jgi:hypothetical protein